MLTNKWNELLQNEFKSDYFHNMQKKINDDKSAFNIFPSEENIFKALRLTDYDQVKCVILGQDPYHEKNQAHGLCFSVPKGEKIPPSLRNIYKELSSDLNIDIPQHGDLTSWAKEGVLLLNTVMTVKEGIANSHKNIGWEKFTDKIITLLNNSHNPIVFILWGNDAKKKINLITNDKHLILTGPHPSPLSFFYGFFGGKYFSKCNEFLRKNNIKEINWKID